MVLVNFWRYPDPYQRFLIRIRIRPNDADPTGSGSETLKKRTTKTAELTFTLCTCFLNHFLFQKAKNHSRLKSSYQIMFYDLNNNFNFVRILRVQ